MLMTLCFSARSVHSIMGATANLHVKAFILFVVLTSVDPDPMSPLIFIVDMTTLILVVTSGCKAMKELQLREAKSTLSAVVEAAEQGEPTTITKDGRQPPSSSPMKKWTGLECEALPLLISFWLFRNLPWRTCRRDVPPGSCVRAPPIDFRLLARHQRDIITACRSAVMPAAKD